MNFILTMSGGTTPVINSTLTGVIKGIKKFYPHSKLYIPKPGIIGLLTNNIYELDLQKFDKKILKQIKMLPGSSLTGTSRVERFNDEQIQTIKTTLQSLNVNTFINIGGSGTIKQSIFLSEKLQDINFIALPKTIDNDLGDNTFKQLLFTPGYLSAAKYLINHTHNLIRENIGACFNDKVVVSQIFGRDTSFLTATTTLVDSDRIITLFPEKPTSKETLLTHVKEKIQLHGGCIIFVAEGYDENIFNTEFSKEYDESGQIKWGSSHNSIAQIISNYLNNNNINTRICNTTIEQRQSGSFLDKGDIKIANKVGYNSIIYSKTQNNFFVGINDKLKTISIKLLDIDVFNRKMPLEWIDESSIKTSEKFKEYFKSLKPGKRIISEVNNLSITNFERKI